MPSITKSFAFAEGTTCRQLQTPDSRKGLYDLSQELFLQTCAVPSVMVTLYCRLTPSGVVLRVCRLRGITLRGGFRAFVPLLCS